MTEKSLPSRAIVKEQPGALLKLLPRLGHVMVMSRVNGATHERIGPVEEIVAEAGEVLVQGARHGASIVPESIAMVQLDCSRGAHGKTLPKLTFLDGDGEAVFAVIGMDGPEAFAALADLSFQDLAADTEKKQMPQGDIADDDQGIVLLNAVAANKLAVTIAVERPGFAQSWHGVVEEVKPAMGFINIMSEDFHLHLRGGSVGRWAKETAGDDVTCSALDTSGQPLGLTVRGSSAAFL